MVRGEVMVKVFFNLKTTGLSRSKRSIVQIGAVVEGSKMTFKKFLRPLKKSVFEEDAVAQHQITYEGI